MAKLVLIGLFELYKLPKDVLQHVLAVALGWVQAVSNAEDVASLPHKVFEVVLVACEWAEWATGRDEGERGGGRKGHGKREPARPGAAGVREAEGYGTR